MPRIPSAREAGVGVDAYSYETHASSHAQLPSQTRLDPSLTPPWLRISSICLSEVGDDALLVTRRSPDGAMASVVPVFVRRTREKLLPTRQLHLLSNLMCYHADLPTTVDYRTTVEDVLGSTDWDTFLAFNVPVDSPVHAAIRELAPSYGSLLETPGSTSPYLSVDRTWEEFLASKNKKFRYKLKRRGEQVDGTDVRIRWFSSSSEIEVLWNAIQSIEDRSWKAKQRRAITQRPHERIYYEALLPHLAESKLLLANVLEHKNTPVAYNLCAHSPDGWIGQLKSSFDEAYADLSPGATAIDAVVRHAFDSGATEFDFLGDAAFHKTTWTSLERRHVNLALYASSTKGRALTLATKSRSRLAQSVRAMLQALKPAK